MRVVSISISISEHASNTWGKRTRPWMHSAVRYNSWRRQPPARQLPAARSCLAALPLVGDVKPEPVSPNPTTDPPLPKALRVSNERPATADILARVDQRRESLLRQHASSRRETRQEISRMRVDAAEDRCVRTCRLREPLHRKALSSFLARGLETYLFL